MYSVIPLPFESGGLLSADGAGRAATVASCGSNVGLAALSAVHFFAAVACALTEPWPPQAKLNNESSFEYIVVGGGTGGAALAARLAQRGPERVLLLEAGGDPPSDSIIPGFSNTLKGGEYDWQYTSEADGVTSRALADGRQAQPRGKMLGGSGSLNDMIYARGFPVDYEGWTETLRQSGDPDADDWDWPKVLEYFKKTERLTDERILNDPELVKLHGLDGEIEVAGHKAAFDTDVFLQAFNETGFNLVKDMTSPYGLGAGKHLHTIHHGTRHSTLTALLNKVNNSNLFVLKNAFVTKVLIENGTAYGVKVIHNNETYQFYAKHEVIVTAGTFNTPKILMLSGIGPKEHLQKFDIDVVQDLPVGSNLQDHVMVLNFVEADNGTCYSTEADGYMNMIQYLYDSSGPYSVINTMAAYLSLAKSSQPNVPDFAYYPSCMSVGTQFFHACHSLLRFDKKICDQLQNILKDKEVLPIAVVLLHPKSRGRVELSSADPLAPPVIYSGTFSDEADLEGYPEATEIVKRLLNTTYFRSKNARYVDLDIDACVDLEGEERVKCSSRASAMAAWHSAGTAPMGTVLDGRLRVRGVRGLRVADASAMPSVIRANTNSPITMIAEKAADYITTRTM